MIIYTKTLISIFAISLLAGCKIIKHTNTKHISKYSQSGGHAARALNINNAKFKISKVGQRHSSNMCKDKSLHTKSTDAGVGFFLGGVWKEVVKVYKAVKQQAQNISNVQSQFQSVVNFSDKRKEAIKSQRRERHRQMLKPAKQQDLFSHIKQTP